LITTWPHTLDSHHCGAAPRQADEGFLREYDFSKAAADLVVSVPGFHRGKPVRTAALHLCPSAFRFRMNSLAPGALQKMDAVGHTRLRALLRDFQWPPADELRDDNIYYQVG
jgi:hypothetical protein